MKLRASLACHLLVARMLSPAVYAQTPPSATPPVSSSVAATPLSAEPEVVRVLLSPDLETTLVSQMNGRITTLNAQLGSAVRKGAVVVGLECSEASARVQMAQAELAAARETLNVKERLRKLDAAGEMEVAVASAAADKARAAVALSRAQVDQCNINAPFSGRVVRLHVKPHQGVSAGAPLVDLISDGPLKIRMNIPSAWLQQVRKGSPLKVRITETGRDYPARITLVNARVDAVAQTIEVEASLDGQFPELLAGMSGTAHFSFTRP